MNRKALSIGRRQGWLILTYFLLTLVLTWPTISHPATHLPGDGADDPAIAWNLWWVKQALLTEAQNPFQTDYMFYPLGVNLAFYTLTVLNAVTALPLTLNVGVVAASNFHMFFTFVAAGYGTFLLVRYVLTGLRPEAPPGSGDDYPVASAQKLIWLSAALAGGFYAFASSKLFYIALGQFNIGSSHWLPFVALYLLRTEDDPARLKNPLMAGLFLTFQAWAEITYATFLVLFIGLYWLYRLLFYAFGHRRRSPPTHSPPPPRPPAPLLHLRAALILGLTFALGLSPILAQILPEMLVEGDFLVEGGGFAGSFSADLLGFIIPTKHHPLGGDLIGYTNITDFTLGQHIYIGFTLLGLAAFGLRAIYRHPALRFWLVAAFVFALLCLGPDIKFNGYDTGLRGPFNLLQQLPFFKGNRYPSRYSVMLMLSLSLLAGFGVWRLSRRFHRTGRLTAVLGLVALLFLFEHLALPLPQSDLRVPAPYRLIADAPEEVVVLDIPFAWRNGFSVIGAQTTQFMFGQFYQTVHQKRLLQGNTSRNPAFKFQYFTQAPVINSLLALESGQPLPAYRWAADRAIAAEVLRFFNIAYIVVRPYSYAWYTGADHVTVTEQVVLPYIESVLPVEKIHDEAAIKIYRVTGDCQTCGLPAPGLIDSQAPLAPLYFGEGWGLISPGHPLAAQRRAVRLLLPLTGDAQQITLRLRLPESHRGPASTFSLALNGWRSSPQKMGRAWAEYPLKIPAGVARPGLNDVWLHFSHVTALPPPGPEAPLLDITAMSAGEERGGYGHIFVNGYDASPNERGYNIVLIEPDHSLTAANFDTHCGDPTLHPHCDPAASSDLAAFIGAASPETIIAVAAADEASGNLAEEAVQALLARGISGDLRGCFRCSHAAVSRPGKIAEAFERFQPAGVTTELGLTAPRLAAIVAWVRVEVIEE